MFPIRGPQNPRRKAVWGPNATLAALVLVFGATAAAAGPKASHDATASRKHTSTRHIKKYKLDDEVRRRSIASPDGTSSVIVTLAPGAQLPAEFRRFARVGKLKIINGQVLDLPNRVIRLLEAHPSIFQVHHNRPIEADDYRTSLAVGARAIERGLGFTGAGIGVAVVDSGISTWHDDLTNHSTAVYPYGNQRVSAFVDFVNGQLAPYDDQGHGTHVAGIIAGNGHSSLGQHAGLAPQASLVSLKVLDSNGQGTISNIIAALDWIVENHARYNIRVVNLSVGATVHESYLTDPLTLATKRVVDAGVVVVTAAGNRGKDALGQIQYGGITAPGNAPWVITVGASSTGGTVTRADDTIASFSSRGPTYLDWSAKPDLVAPGHGMISLVDAASAMYQEKAPFLIPGASQSSTMPYLALSGTSMSAPVVSGTVALMLQANPSLSPNAVKAILQYTAQEYTGFDAITEGAGFLNSVGAVRLAQFFASAQPGEPIPLQKMWSKKIIWGNHRLSGGVIAPDANAFSLGTTWGVAKTDSGDNIIWGTTCDGGCDNIIWGTAGEDNIIWGTEGDDNIIWGTEGDDNIIWGTSGLYDNIIWGTDCGGADCDNIIWGTTADNIIWGTARQGDNIIWGTSGDALDGVVWGASGEGLDNIIWGTSEELDNIIWGTSGEDNIIWGTDGDNIIWGTAVGDQVIWNGSVGGSVQVVDWNTLIPVLNDEQVFAILASLEDGSATSIGSTTTETTATSEANTTTGTEAGTVEAASTTSETSTGDSTTTDSTATTTESTATESTATTTESTATTTDSTAPTTESTASTTESATTESTATTTESTAPTTESTAPTTESATTEATATTTESTAPTTESTGTTTESTASTTESTTTEATATTTESTAPTTESTATTTESTASTTESTAPTTEAPPPTSPTEPIPTPSDLGGGL
jgi:serine protease AprX